MEGAQQIDQQDISCDMSQHQHDQSREDSDEILCDMSNNSSDVESFPTSDEKVVTETSGSEIINSKKGCHIRMINSSTDTCIDQTVDMDQATDTCMDQKIDVDQATVTDNLEEMKPTENLILEKLPIEILMHIFNFLDARFIISTLTKVCMEFEQMFASDIYWKTRISKQWPKKYPPVLDEKFDWTEACIEREEQYRQWIKPQETCEHFMFTDGIFSSVDGVHLMKEGTLLATGSRDRSLNLLDLSKYNPDKPESLNEMKILNDSKAHKGWIWSFASLDNVLVTGSWDTYVKMWDISAGCTEMTKFKCKSALLGLHMEENALFAAGYDKKLYSLDARSGEVTWKKLHKQPVLCLKANQDYIITGSEDKSIAIFDRRANAIYKKIELDDSYPMSISFSHNQLWVGDKSGQIHVYDASYGKFDHIESYDIGHTGKVTGIVYTPGALFTCSTDNLIKVLEPNINPGVINTLSVHNGAVARLAVQNGVLASAGSDVSVGIWIPKANIVNTMP